jgi:hypothetical protein
LGEWIGAPVDWNPPNIVLAKDPLKAELTTGNTTEKVTDARGSRDLTLALAPRVIHGTTHVPLRFVAGALGVTVDYRMADHAVALALGGRTASLPVRDMEAAREMK